MKKLLILAIILASKLAIAGPTPGATPIAAPTPSQADVDAATADSQAADEALKAAENADINDPLHHTFPPGVRDHARDARDKMNNLKTLRGQGAAVAPSALSYPCTDCK